MKQYHSINTKINTSEPVYVFDKLDGSNIRAEWTRKRGFYKFGSRRQLIDRKHTQLGEAVDLIRNKYEDDITQICRKQKYERILCFFEFFGPNSFAGNHEEEPHDVVLFDVNVHRKGIQLPQDFIKQFGQLDIASKLYFGRIGPEFLQSVKESTLEGMTFEGVVCKTIKGGMFKVKSQAWYDKLKKKCGDDEEQFEKLK